MITMGARVQIGGPHPASGRGIVLGKAGPGAQPERHVFRADPDLEISVDVLGDEVVRGLIDDWLAPLIVDALIREFVDGLAPSFETTS